MRVDIKNIQYLCFGVGGSNGWIFVGILKAIEQEMRRRDLSLHSQIRGASGASVGSLIALSVVLGYGAEELGQFARLTTERYGSLMRKINVLEMIAKGGLVSTEIIALAAQDMIAQKLGDDARGMTFKELYAATGKELVVAAYNLSYERGELLDRQSAPTMPVYRALEMSCAIPGVFQGVVYGDCVYLDAAMANPLPFEVFDMDKSLVCNVYGHHGYARPDDMSAADRFCRVTHIYNCITREKIQRLSPAERAHVLSLEVPCLTSSILNGFSLSKEERDRLVEVGMNAGLTLFYHQTALMSQAAALYSSLFSSFRTGGGADASPLAERSVKDGGAVSEPLLDAQRDGEIKVAAEHPPCHLIKKVNE